FGSAPAPACHAKTLPFGSGGSRRRPLPAMPKPYLLAVAGRQELELSLTLPRIRERIGRGFARRQSDRRAGGGALNPPLRSERPQARAGPQAGGLAAREQPAPRGVSAPRRGAARRRFPAP